MTSDRPPTHPPETPVINVRLLGEVLLSQGDKSGAQAQFVYVNQRQPDWAWAAGGMMRTGVVSSATTEGVAVESVTRIP